MSAELLPAVDDIRVLFEDVLASQGGQLKDSMQHADRCFLRGVLPDRFQVRAADFMRPGVAVMTAADAVCMHPFLYREVCDNGAILCETTQSCTVQRIAPDASPFCIEATRAELRSAVETCCSPEAFEVPVAQVRSAVRAAANLSLHLFPALLRQRTGLVGRHLDEIVRRFTAASDHSVYGLMNAVTSTARDEPDPEQRWRLEELGGAIPALLRPRQRDPQRTHAPQLS